MEYSDCKKYADVIQIERVRDVSMQLLQIPPLAAALMERLAS
ncbi:MAG: hypothetical protein AAGE99_02345 [Chlamydiota bacterium]